MAISIFDNSALDVFFGILFLAIGKFYSAVVKLLKILYSLFHQSQKTSITDNAVIADIKGKGGRSW
jgi:hypothetical protein